MLSRIFNTIDTNTTAYSVAKYDPTAPLKVSCLGNAGLKWLANLSTP